MVVSLFVKWWNLPICHAPLSVRSCHGLGHSFSVLSKEFCLPWILCQCLKVNAKLLQSPGASGADIFPNGICSTPNREMLEWDNKPASHCWRSIGNSSSAHRGHHVKTNAKIALKRSWYTKEVILCHSKNETTCLIFLDHSYEILFGAPRSKSKTSKPTPPTSAPLVALGCFHWLFVAPLPSPRAWLPSHPGGEWLHVVTSHEKSTVLSGMIFLIATKEISEARFSETLCHYHLISRPKVSSHLMA